MQLIRNLLTRLCRFALIAGSLTILLSCSASPPVTTSNILIRFPNATHSALAAEKKTFSNISASTLGFNWNLVCYLVNVSASDIKTSKSSTCDIPLSVFKGSVPPGGKLSLEVPAGSNRLVDVLVYLRSAESDSCPVLSMETGLAQLSRTRFVRVGQTASVDMTKPSVEVEVEISTPLEGVNLVTQYNLPDSCKPDNSPQGSSTSRVTTAHSVISGNSGSQTLIVSGSISGLQSEKILQGNGGVTVHLSRKLN